ncbi:hypothetical protein DTO164E3_8104 [Paecilomyces variotii]|nr:hypothetical protein DTO164E3_8104 [Paecilomyces variotii]KAJ9277420.1 hypothetical protein DTO021D3_5670 [Paecilomyces variotii]KAJ9410499.1 hypothetical protein DTO045G8_1962 [Paecilomyces variotii]
MPPILVHSNDFTAKGEYTSLLPSLIARGNHSRIVVYSRETIPTWDLPMHSLISLSTGHYTDAGVLNPESPCCASTTRPLSAPRSAAEFPSLARTKCLWLLDGLSRISLPMDDPTPLGPDYNDCTESSKVMLNHLVIALTMFQWPTGLSELEPNMPRTLLRTRQTPTLAATRSDAREPGE